MQSSSGNSRFRLLILIVFSVQCATASAADSEEAFRSHRNRIESHTLLSAEKSASEVSTTVGAASIACWSVVIEDTVLDQDLDCGFTVASGVTVDLGGHTVRRIATCGFSEERCETYRAERITLRNGTVEGWITLEGCYRCVLDRMTVKGHNDFAVELGTRNLVIHSRFVGNYVGVSSYFGGGHNVIMLSTFENNLVGLQVSGDNHNVIWRNRFTGNCAGVTLYDEDGYAASDNIVTGNIFTENRCMGVNVYAWAEAERNLISQNLFWGNQGPGIAIQAICEMYDCDDYEPLCGGGGTRVERNVLIANGTDPFELGYPDPEDPEVSRTVLVDDGISVPAEFGGNEGVTLRANRAFLNSDLGIDAPGVVDGGRNVAVANGDRRECVGVRCRGPAGNRRAGDRSRTRP